MRIAIIYFGRRGAGGIISFELARKLGQKHEVFVFLSGMMENPDRWSEANIETIQDDTFHNSVEALLSLVFPVQIHRVVGKIRQRKPDILLFPMFHPWNSMIQKALRDIPSVVFVHDPRPHPDLSGWFYERLENASIRRATRCVILSETLRSFLVDRGVSLDRIDVVPLGPFIFPPSSSFTRDQDPLPTLLFFGRIVPYKGLDLLLRSFMEVRKSFPCRLLIAGDGNITPYKDVLEELQDVTLVNRWIAETEIADFFARSDLVVLPYTSASQSGVIPIAAVFGLPVIATTVGGLSEQIEDGVSGWLVPPGDVHRLADAVREVLSNPQMARKRGQALKERYEKNFGWEQGASQLVKSLERALHSRDSV
jgi:glycosyltransferase involved in cell wall biosynthesis